MKCRTIIEDGMRIKKVMVYDTLIIIFLITMAMASGCREKKDEQLVDFDYSSWKKTTDVELNYFIPGHEGHYRIPYINKTGENVEVAVDERGKKSYNYPEGTIIIKEIYPNLQLREGDKPIMLTVMIKKEDHEHAQGGWVWIVKQLDSGKEVVFKSDMCVYCHDGANGRHPYGDKNPNEEFRDYVFFPYMKN
jgi:hypothetical protein